MDGITAMEGNGPGSGDPVAMNLILMSTDPVALDSVFARQMCIRDRYYTGIYQGSSEDDRTIKYISHCRTSQLS